MTTENATNRLDTAATVELGSEEVPPGRVKSQSTELGRDENPLPQATAGFQPEGVDENFDYFRHMMESNEPPPGICASEPYLE